MPRTAAPKTDQIRADKATAAINSTAEVGFVTRLTARAVRWIAAACFLSGLFFLFWRGPLPLEGFIRACGHIDALAGASAMVSDLATLRHYYALSLGTALCGVALCIVAGSVWIRAGRKTQESLSTVAFTLATSGALIIYLTRMEVQGPWMPVSLVMRNPGALPIFGHRLLFVWIALGFERIAPHISDLQAFYLSQCVAIVLTMHALGRWSALHGGKVVSWVGQAIGALMLSTCFSYYNFYDIGTVFFTTCGLTAIYLRRYWWLLPIVLIGTVNYEGLLLLIPVAAFLAWDTERPEKWLPPLAASLIAYISIRFALQAAIPVSHRVDWRIWSNIIDPFVNTRQIAYSAAALLGWYALGLMNLRHCDWRLKRMVLLFPLLLAVTFLFGQLHEPRQFDAFIPVVVAILVSGFKRKLILSNLSDPHASTCLDT